MSLSRPELDGLIKAVALTRADELSCGDCIKELAEFAERHLAGKSVSAGLEAIEHHLAICMECKEEYQALLTALKDDK
jgi:hypothetical protein